MHAMLDEDKVKGFTKVMVAKSVIDGLNILLVTYCLYYV